MSSVDELLWWYKDSTGQIFGPFPQLTMKNWFDAGYFPMGGELEVRHTDQEGEYVQIKELFGEPIKEKAFKGPPRNPGHKARGGGSGRANRGGGGGGSGGGSNAQPPAFPNSMGMDVPGAFDGGMNPLLGSPYMLPGMGMPAGMGMPFMPNVSRPGMGSPFGGMGPGFPFPGASMPGIGASTGRFSGRIKSFNQQKGFGFIDCAEAHAVYNRDVFLHKAQIGTFQIGSNVSFAVEMNKQSMPQARDLREDMGVLGYGSPMPGLAGFPGASMPMGMPGGKGGGYNSNNPKGGGKGKAGGGKNNKNKPKGDKGGKAGGDNKKNGGGGKSPQQQPQQPPLPAPEG